MKQSRLRLSLFMLWVGFFVVLLIICVFAPTLREDGSIGDEQVLPMVSEVASFFFPPLSFFSAFWFREEQRIKARRMSARREQAIGAIVFTLLVLSFLLMLVVHGLFLADYLVTPDVDTPAPGTSLEERMQGAIRLAALLSPLALAPAAWVTGQESST